MADSYDVIVVGSGNAGLCAAVGAAQDGSSVLVLDRAPYAQRGGNTSFSAGAFRFCYSDGDELLPLLADIPPQQLAVTDFGSYTEEQYFLDVARVTDHRADPDLAEALVRDSAATMRWLRGLGIRFQPMYGRQSFEVAGRHRFYGGVTLEVQGGGVGLVDGLLEAARGLGVDVQFGTRVRTLVMGPGGVEGVQVTQERRPHGFDAASVVLATGGFEANAEWRTRYLGPGWELAKVRGSRYNTGDGIRMGLEAGGAPAGNWSRCHAVAWDRNAPDVGDLKVGDIWNKHSYPLGIVVNQDGNRFVDEGADLRNYTYAKYGPKILEQPGQVAWQVFDAQVIPLLRDEYRVRQASRVRAETLEELASRMEGLDAAVFLRTVREYNDAVRVDVPFDPSVKDGRRTEGLELPKSNWANRLDSPPFEAYQVTCGITFTFGGLRVRSDGRVVDDGGEDVPGLFAAGELAGGLFYFNYPGGSGLMSGSVIGRRAGIAAAGMTGIR